MPTCFAFRDLEKSVFSILEAEQVGLFVVYSINTKNRTVANSNKISNLRTGFKNYSHKIATKNLISSITFAKINLLRIDWIDAISNRRF